MSTEKKPEPTNTSGPAVGSSDLLAATQATVDHVNLTMACIECAPEIRDGVMNLLRESFQAGFKFAMEMERQKAG